MANSLTTRCPKCSTAFRVSDDVLSMAKGKVRCGQCFHIFDAQQASVKTGTEGTSSASRQANTTPQSSAAQTPNKASSKAPTTPAAMDTDSRLAPAEEVVNPDWLSTLFTDDDLQPALDSDIKHSADQNAQQDSYQQRIHQAQADTTSRADTSLELAPWEVELAEVEAALQSRPKRADNVTPRAAAKATPRKTITPETQQETPQPTAAKKSHTTENVASSPVSSSSHQQTNQHPTSTVPSDAERPSEPDYMTALHSLAQSAAEQTRPPAGAQQHSFLEQLSAQQSLAPLLEEAKASAPVKRSHPWLWFIAIVLGLAVLTGQAANHFFDEGSRSSHFRGFYRMLCSYTGCTLPRFEDVSAISLQHVRIQSHPSIPNALMVNAIITNNSAFSQPMPKIALEFFDLNGKPVAARLFAPSDYLHKDFLDITFMPPNTPIHVVIPIQDPGARAVTHELKAFPADTRSY